MKQMDSIQKYCTRAPRMLLIVVAAVMWTGCGGKKVSMVPAAAVPAATGTVDLGKDRNGNTQIDLKVQHLAKPENLTPPKSTYIVWIQARDGRPENQGQLHVNDNLEGEFKAPTPLRTFDIFVTAEDGPSATSPNGPEVFHKTVHR
ncbi:MAG: hypothetical protein ACJ74Z_00380 [Bryobacteraceae bacterium]